MHRAGRATHHAHLKKEVFFAYSELYFTPVLWPDFSELEFARALADYGRRERRFGGRREPDGIVAGGDLDA